MNSTVSNSMDDQLAEFSSIFPNVFSSYQVPGLDVTNNYTVSNRPDKTQSTNPVHYGDPSFTGPWMDLGTAASSLPSTLFSTSNEQARGPQKEIVQDKTHGSSCYEPKPQ
ncbi:uncharacterized protein N7483_008991 [Penicillium malachiteum]|uniref:uncharacterized protein n=1 Tax=Penicillium malachiteum TaxID=1324776 RepID=UPI0025492874|nr:uncharacterized protein N7483_008991 [Penicillium malachiteum]KAJ5721057.1 hypothetical protein N7483_008991 [Penicillium malachiteum]